MKNLLKTVSYLFILVVTLSSCSKDNSVEEIIDDRDFATNPATDFFINKDSTVDLNITGEFTDSGKQGDVKRRGFVYGTTSNLEVASNNTLDAAGSNPVHATIKNLEAKKTFFVRGFFEYTDGTFFYGNEVQFSTDLDFSTTRTLTMTIKSELFFQNNDGITPELVVTEITQESPVDIGFEYSINQDFSNSSIALEKDLTISENIWKTTYSEFIEGLTSNTVYYFRPYAKYGDGTVTNGGTSAASFTTK